MLLLVVVAGWTWAWVWPWPTRAGVCKLQHAAAASVWSAVASSDLGQHSSEQILIGGGGGGGGGRMMGYKIALLTFLLIGGASRLSPPAQINKSAEQSRDRELRVDM